jgi:UDP-3-O-[3-hydroxymyristoyl] glucosamine N-acyltransferase
VKIYHHCVIGKQVTIHAGSVIGADGFGFAPQNDGSFKKIPQWAMW